MKKIADHHIRSLLPTLYHNYSKLGNAVLMKME